MGWQSWGNSSSRATLWGHARPPAPEEVTLSSNAFFLKSKNKSDLFSGRKERGPLGWVPEPATVCGVTQHEQGLEGDSAAAPGLLAQLCSRVPPVSPRVVSVSAPQALGSSLVSSLLSQVPLPGLEVPDSRNWFPTLGPSWCFSGHQLGQPQLLPLPKACFVMPKKSYSNSDSSVGGY